MLWTIITTVIGGVILLVVVWIWRTKIYLLLTRLSKKLGRRIKLIFRHKETTEQREAKEFCDALDDALDSDEGWNEWP